MSTRACFVILTLCYIILSFAFNDQNKVHHLLSEVCQYTNFCHINARAITESKPCCLPCSCDDDCWELDNCCPDKELINRPRPPIVPCRNSYVKLPNDNSANTRFYRVIDSCPSSEEKSNLNRKCRRENKTSLEAFVWVSDKTGKIYQNTYCAECHGIKESIPWHTETRCYDIMRANFSNFREMLLSEKCNIINTPPEYLKTVINKFTCLNPKNILYSSCNETGLMVSYDPDVEIACLQSTWPFVLDPYLAKNVFCAMCNHDIPTSSSDKLCSLDIRGHDSDFTFLIDYTSLSADTLEEVNDCSLDELFDKFTGLCRKLMCPIGTAPFHGRCKQLVSKVTGLEIGIQYGLDMIRNQTSLFTDYGQDYIWQEIFTQFTKLLDLNSNCQFCNQRLETTEENSTSDFIFEIIIKIKSGCDYGLLLTKLADMQDKAIEIVINSTTVLTILVRSNVQPSTISLYDGPQTIFSRFLDFCSSVYSLSFDDINCPRFEIHYKDLELLSSSDKKEREAFASFFIRNGTEKNDTRAFVCLDTYMSVMSQPNSAVDTVDKKTIPFLQTILFVLILTAFDQW